MNYQNMYPMSPLQTPIESPDSLTDSLFKGVPGLDRSYGMYMDAGANTGIGMNMPPVNPAMNASAQPAVGYQPVPIDQLAGQNMDYTNPVQMSQFDQDIAKMQEQHRLDSKMSTGDKFKSLSNMGIGLLQGYNAYRANRLGRESLNFNKQAYAENISNQKKTLNRQLEHAWQVAENAKAGSVGTKEDYMEKYGY